MYLLHHSQLAESPNQTIKKTNQEPPWPALQALRQFPARDEFQCGSDVIILHFPGLFIVHVYRRIHA